MAPAALAAVAAVLSVVLAGCTTDVAPDPGTLKGPPDASNTAPPTEPPSAPGVNDTTNPGITWPRDYSLAQHVLVPGAGYSWLDLPRDGRVGKLEDADISPDGSLVALGFEYGNAEVWSTNGTLVAALQIDGNVTYPASPCDGSRGTVRFVGNDRLMVLFNNCVKVFDFNGTVAFEMSKNNAVVWYPDVLISEDGHRIAALDEYDWVLVADLVSGERFKVPIVYPSITQFALSPRGDFLITVDGATRFWRLEAGNPNGTLFATLARVGNVAFSDDPRYVFQDAHDGRGPVVNALERYEVAVGGVTNESWSCERPEGALLRPLCPHRDSRFDAAGATNRVAWVGHLTARWQEEDAFGRVSGNETYLFTVNFFDWGVPNGTRGFQVGPSTTYSMNPLPHSSPRGDWNHEAVVRVFVMPDGGAFAVSKIGQYGSHIQLTHASADAVLPTVIENHV